MKTREQGFIGQPLNVTTDCLQRDAQLVRQLFHCDGTLGMDDSQQGELSGVWVHAENFIELVDDLTVKRKKKKITRVNTKLKGAETNNNSPNRKFDSLANTNKKAV
jgi:hypothetical protein